MGVGGAGVAVAVGVGVGVGVGGIGVAVALACAGAVDRGVGAMAVAAGAMGVSASGALNADVAVGAAPGAGWPGDWPGDGARKWDGASQLSARMTASARLAQKSVTPGSALDSAPCGVSRGVSWVASGAESG